MIQRKPLLRRSGDSLGWRMKFAVIAPSTNTSAAALNSTNMRPLGVTNHFGGIHIPDDPIRDDAEFNALMDNIRREMDNAVIRVKTSQPDHLIMGMSSETFWDGLEGSVRLKARMEALAGVGVTMGSDACRAALREYGEIRRIGVITPYMPVGDAQVRKFFEESGFEVVNSQGA